MSIDLTDVPYCLDVTRLISRVGRGPLTGIDRVERAYLQHLIGAPRPLMLLARTWLGYLLLDQAGAEDVLDRIDGRARWGPPDVLSHFQRKAHPGKRRAESDLRRLAVGRAPRGRLRRLLNRWFRSGASYVNVGHSNLTHEVLSAWDSVAAARITVLVHDMIPLDYPEFQRPGTAAQFEARMRRVAAFSDQVLCISRDAEARVQHWFGTWGDPKPTCVVSLGVDLILPDPAQLPNLPAAPYFVTVGTIEPRKNHALLLDIWHSLTTDAAVETPTLVIVGARGWRNEAVFARLDAKPAHVLELNGLSDGGLAALVENSAGMLFPTLAEGFGLPPAEALSLGTPVICSDLPVLREILGNSPIYAKPDDMYLWKQYILQMAGGIEAARSDRAGRTGNFQRPTWTDHFNLVLKVL